MTDFATPSPVNYYTPFNYPNVGPEAIPPGGADYYAGQYQNMGLLQPLQNVDYSTVNAAGTPAYWSGQKYYAPGGEAAAEAVMNAYNGATPEQLARYGISPDQGNLDMIRATGQSVLANKYFQTPGYQLLFGSDYAQMDPRLNPAQRFQHSPGYQYAMDEALRQTNQANAARGLLESGRGQRNLVQTAQGLAMQDYYNWWDRLSQNYENYQNRLANLASAGMGASGSQNVLGTSGTQAQLASGLGQTGSSLLANQGQFGATGMFNTGAGQSQNMMTAADINARVAMQESQNQTQLASAGIGAASSLLGGLF